MPTTMAPALRSRATTGWSRSAGSLRQAGDPSVQTSPATSTLSFTAMGTPASGRANRVRAVSMACASEGADAGVDPVDVVEMGTDDVDRRHLPRAHQSRDLGGGQADRPGGGLSRV